MERDIEAGNPTHCLICKIPVTVKTAFTIIVNCLLDSWRRDWFQEAQRSLEETLSNGMNTNVAKNVIFFLGDGMGVSTVTAGRIYMGQKKGHTGEEANLVFDKFPHVALAKVGKIRPT